MLTLAQFADQNEAHAGLRPPPPNMPPDDPLRDTPAVAHRGQSFLERLLGHRVDAEGGEQFADDRVRRHVAALEIVEVRADLTVDEVADRVAHGDVYV